MNLRHNLFWCFLIFSLLSNPSWCAAQEENESTADSEVVEEKLPPGRTEYLGREIAQTMHFLGAPWLIRDSREREEDCSTMLKNLGVKPGMTICDMGCGNGFYSLKMAEMVGEKGKILA
ncbi:MAG: class I SAM-dependent methyltransferase, partial [Planctomycetota bacterium]